jgi:meso-butanediol dehydrogenase/(S,S)-butanediol dehydrogenase/diacetyl reductase
LSRTTHHEEVEPMPERVLNGQSAIVTGGGQGVGRGIALALAGRGATVALVGRTASKLEAVAAEIADRDGAATTHVCDVKDPAQIIATVASVVEHAGRLDILVNNAQESLPGTMLEVSDAALIAGFESGPLAAFRFMRACYPHLRGGGVIINLGSGTSVNPQATSRGVYAAVKATITTLSRTAATEWGADGIRVLTVMPAAAGPSVDRYRENFPDLYEKSLESIPLHRLGDPETDIGSVVAFLCSPDASYLTGTTISIDGGQAFLR